MSNQQTAKTAQLLKHLVNVLQKESIVAERLSNYPEFYNEYTKAIERRNTAQNKINVCLEILGA